MTPNARRSNVVATFTDTQRDRLCALREHFGSDRDLFNKQELARLRFVRWLYDSGRLTA